MRVIKRLLQFVVVLGIAGAIGLWVSGADRKSVVEAAAPYLSDSLRDKARQFAQVSVSAQAQTPAASSAPPSSAPSTGGRPAAPPALVLSAVAQAEPFVISRRAIGYVEPMAQVVVKARIDSQITTQAVRDGAMVKAGDILFTLDDRELRAQLERDEAQLERDAATLVRTKADLVRKKELVDKGAGTAQAYDQAVADEAVARATLTSDKATVALDKARLDYTVIRSPINGRAGTVNVTAGNVIKAADTGPGLVTITQIDPIRVSLQLSERELPKLAALFAAGTPPKITVYTTGTKKILAEGPATFLDSVVDLPSGTVALKAEFANPTAALWPGMFVDVDVALEQLPAVVVIPTVASQIGQKGQFVFVMKPDLTVEMRPIEVLATDGPRLAVAAGLVAGERVVVEGQGRLVHGAKVRDGNPKEPPKEARQPGRSGAVAFGEKQARGQGE